MKKSFSRRQFLENAALIATGSVLGANKLFAAPAYIPNLFKSRSFINGVNIGCITYSFRDMPDQSAEATLKYVLDAGLGQIELMGGPAESFAGAPKMNFDFREIYPIWGKQQKGEVLTDDEKNKLTEAQKARKAGQEEMAKWRLKAPMKKFDQVRKMYNDAGVKIYAFKPDAFGKDNTDTEVAYGLEAAKRLGASHVTLEHPGDDEQTLRLGRLAEKYGLKVAYHGHEQQTPVFWNTALLQSPANSLNLDLGHFVAAGNLDPISMVRAKHSRISSMHIKDRQKPENGKGNLPWGQGDTPIAQVLRLMRDNQYSFPATIELEYKVPENSNAVAEVKKCVEFCANALA